MLSETHTILVLGALFACLLIAFHVIVRMLRELHLSMNSRLDQLLKSTGELARSEGFRAGQLDEQGQLAGLREAASALKDPKH